MLCFRESIQVSLAWEPDKWTSTKLCSKHPTQKQDNAVTVSSLSSMVATAMVQLPCPTAVLAQGG
jgi:hypothetical protein